MQRHRSLLAVKQESPTEKYSLQKARLRQWLLVFAWLILPAMLIDLAPIFDPSIVPGPVLYPLVVSLYLPVWIDTAEAKFHAM